LVVSTRANTHAPPSRRIQHSLTPALLLVVALASACGGADEDYCGSVKEHQAELTDVTASGAPSALLDALPILRDLSTRAPDDISDEWQVLLDPLERLDEAVRAADVDPASYDPRHLPAGLTDGERQRIEDAGAALADPAVGAAFDGIQQQAKDVCHTPLSL
jgi:hypothetical protein